MYRTARFSLIVPALARRVVRATVKVPVWMTRTSGVRSEVSGRLRA